MRTVAAVAVFLFGTTFLWMTPAMNGDDSPPTGTAWDVVQALAWLAVIGYAVGAWGIIRALDWWPAAVTGAALAGLATTVAFLVAVQDAQGVPNIAANATIHAGISLLLLVLVVVPPVRAGLARHVDQ